MSTPPRNLPRFLPTLTEVVHPRDLVISIVPAAQDPEEIAKSVMQQVDLVIERHLREEVNAILRILVTEQLKTLNDRLRNDIGLVVRQAVLDAMTLRDETQKTP